MTTEKTELKLGNAPGVAPDRIPELDAAGAAYDAVKKERMELTKREVEAKKKVIDLVHKHEKALGRDPKGAIHYKTDEMSVDLTPSDEKLKVKLKGDEDEEGDED